MSFYDEKEAEARIANTRKILKDRNLDAALVYYDELNVANGWYLTGWCPQFEKGAVLVPLAGEPLLLGGPESEPFAKMSSAVKATRNFYAFMVPGEEYPNATIIDFAQLNAELKSKGCDLKSIGLVGTNTLPYQVYVQLERGFQGVRIEDITEPFEAMRAFKTPWESANVKKGFDLSLMAYEAMKKVIKPGVSELEIAAEGEYVCRKNGANSFAYGTIVGSGERTNAVVPTAIDKTLAAGEWVMIGVAPRVKGYAGTMGDTLPVQGDYSAEQKKAINVLRKALRATRDTLKPGMSGREIDVPARKIFTEEGLIQYLVCPFAHTIGLMEAEGPFYGPGGDDKLAEGMTVCVDVSFFGHPTLYGARVETGYIITKDGCKPLSPEMDAYFSKDV